MRSRDVLVALTFALAACQTGHPLPRVEVPPPVPMAAAPAPQPVAQTDEAATQRWLKQEIEQQRGGVTPTPEAPAPAAQQTLRPVRPMPETDENATRAWLDRTIEERRAAQPDQPPEPIYRTVTVDRPVYVDRTVYAYPGYHGGYVYGYGYDACGEPIYRTYYPARCESTFPIHTALGAGVGAIIGYQSHQAGQGAWIGAGIGLLLDLAR
jgi:hypothetical protein